MLLVDLLVADLQLTLRLLETELQSLVLLLKLLDLLADDLLHVEILAFSNLCLLLVLEDDLLVLLVVGPQLVCFP